MINKYAEIYKRAQLYKAARGILRTKLAFGNIDAVSAWTGPEVLKAYNSGNLTENMSRLVYQNPQAYGITPSMGALTNFEKLPGAPTPPAATGQPAANTAGQAAASTTGQAAANSGLTKEQKLINRLTKQKGMQAAKASKYYNSLMKTRWGLGLTAAALALPAAYGTYKFFSGNPQQQPQPMPYMQQQGYQYFNSPNAF